MPEKYQDFLAANVLNQGIAVNYRTLSRHLKVHSNVAKQMLFEFHKTQNARKSGSVHCTYLICGLRSQQDKSQANGTHHGSGGDTLMSDDSFMMSSSLPGQDLEDEEKIPVTTVTLVPEEQLNDIRKQYEAVSSIHVYSLEPSALSNIGILSECNRKITADYAEEDPLEAWKQYGTIQNPTIKRRSNRQPPPPPPTIPSAPKPAAAVTATPKSEVKESTAGKSMAKNPTQVKRESSDLFKSFAKSKTQQDTQSADQKTGAHSNPVGSLGSTKPEPPTKEDESMKDIPDIDSEADDEEEQVESEEAAEQRKADAAAAKEKAEENRKARLEREAKLQEMMEDDDDDMSDENTKQEDADGDEKMADTEMQDTSTADNAVEGKEAAADEQAANVTVSNGRRRGRRRVMKKKTTKDAEGYLVTKEEPVWESFSEDEPVPAPKATPKPSVGSTAKVKKGAKEGQGSIMNFFGKK